jgi:RNA polymerase sigma factor (sigma-70 family)
MNPSERGRRIGRELSPADQGRKAAEAAFRIEWPRLVARLTRITGDIDAAEDLAQAAMVAAVEQWPRDGVPVRPGGWLMVTAKHRAVDRLRRDATFARKLSELGREASIEEGGQPLLADLDLDHAIEDDLLRMIFTACHPVLPAPARAALTLRMVGGLTTEEIARAYLVPESTVAQRIVRAKRALAAKRVPYAVPSGPDLTARLDSVLAATGALNSYHLLHAVRGDMRASGASSGGGRIVHARRGANLQHRRTALSPRPRQRLHRRGSS